MIESVIGHIKSDHCMERNMSGGELRDKLNAMLSAVGFNRKFVVTSGFSLPTEDKAGIVTVGLIPFLLDASILES